MPTDFLRAVHCEWLKRRRSLASWLVVLGAFFTPAIVSVARLLGHERLAQLYASDEVWTRTWKDSWESMAIFLLPLAAILTTSLMTQIEYRNNAWKQVHTLPLAATTIFLSKLTVVVLMIVQFVVLFDVGVYISVVVPWLLVSGVPYPAAHLPLQLFAGQSAQYLVDCLPIVAAQYLLSLHFRNFLAPVGLGFLAWIGALGALSWRFGFVVPYTYTMLTYLRDSPGKRVIVPAFDVHGLAVGYFTVFVVAGCWLFTAKRQKG